MKSSNSIVGGISAMANMSFIRAARCAALLAALTPMACQAPPPPVGPSSKPAGASVYRPQETGRRERRSRAAEGAPGEFDFYLLNLSWSPEFCATHSDSAECTRRLGFVVHGLWPQNDDGSYPQNCSNSPGPADPQADTDIMPTASLVEHEWKTHGTCSGLAANDYFALIHKAYGAVQIPSSIGTGGDAQGVTPDDLLARFAAANPDFPRGSFALSCGNNRLTAVEVCLGKDLRPESCQGVRSCRANVVKVTPP
jgi:ribonuclease T2